MGLDIAFDRQQALAAGLVLRKELRGNPEEIRIAEAQEEGVRDQGYIDWLKAETEYVAVPNTALYAEISGTDQIIIRANKYGYTYRPLTEWLRSHNIAWSEHS